MEENINRSCNSSFQIVMLPPIYGVEMCVALVINILALWVLVTKEKDWNIGVVFSCNLVISDICYALTLPLLIDYYSKRKKWEFGDAVCKIERFLFTLNLYVSIYFIMCIGVSRYLAIVHPFFTHENIRPKHARIISVLVWIFVASISSPVLYYAGVKKNRCSLFSEPDQRSLKVICRVVMSVLGCFVPFTITLASYFGVIIAVYKNANISSLQKKQVTLTVGLVCILFFVSFIPYHILKIWYFKIKEEGNPNYIVCNGYPISKVLACLNMCLHPILYMTVFDSITCCKGRLKEYL